MAVLTVIAAVAILGILIFIYYKHKFKYWKKRNIPFLEPRIPFGSVQGIKRTKSFGEQIKDVYLEFKEQNIKHGGVYLMGDPAYIPLDLEVVKQILTRDFDHFMDRGLYVNSSDPLSAHLIALSGEKWRYLRQKLTPTFTSLKLKTMFPTIMECSKALEEVVDQMLSERKNTQEMKELASRFTTDIIGCCAFGLDFSAIKDENSEFRVHGRQVFRKSKMRLLKSNIALFFPKIARLFNLKLIPSATADFFVNVVRQTIEYREENNVNRPDFMQLLINMRNNQNEDEGINLSIQDIAAQCFVFFLAGFETSSTTIAFVLYELAKNLDIQDRVRAEIRRAIENHGDLTYEALGDLKFMDQVIDETMRMYPALPFLSRKCVEDCRIDDDLTIEKGTRCIIPVLGIHYDKDYFPEPTRFNPDRFSPDNVDSIPQYAHLPFGDGPRNCIGSRFGLLETKVGLAVLLKKYEFSPNILTDRPIKLNPRSMVTVAQNGIWLDISPVQN